LQADQLLCERSYPIAVFAVPPNVHPHVAANGPAQLRKRLSERRDGRPRQGTVFVARYEHTDPAHPAAPAAHAPRAAKQRPRRRVQR
jgi:hypothetical protein